MHRKWLLLLIPALVLIGGFFYLHYSLQRSIHEETQQTPELLPASDTLRGEKVSKADLRPLFIKRLQQLLKQSTNNLYDLTVGDLEVDVLASTVSLHQVTMKPNAQTVAALKQSGQLPNAVYTVSFKKLLIEGINLDDAITSKTMDYKLIKVVDPVIEINQYKSKKKKQEDKEAFSQRFLQQMQKLDIKKLVVEGGIVVTYKGGKKAMQLNNVQANLTDILVDSTTRTDPQRFLFAKAAQITIRNYRTQTKDGLYTLKVGRINIAVPQQQVVLQNFSFNTPLSKQQFVKRHKYSQELYRLTLPVISLKNVNWWAVLNGEEVAADAITITSGRLSVYFDRSLPAKSRMGNFPNQMLMKLPVKLDVSKLHVRNLDLSYEEFNPISQQSGTVYIDNVNMQVSNLSNQNEKPVVVSGTAVLMHQVPVKAQFRFDMARHKSGAFTAQISTDKTFEADIFNPVAVPLGLVQLQHGVLKKLQTNISGSERQAHGDVLVLYNDLKLNLLEKQGDTLDKKDVTTLLANAFLLKDDNPKPGAAPRRESASFERIPEGGFFALVWKTLLVGVLKTIGAPTKIASKTTNGPVKK